MAHRVIATGPQSSSLDATIIAQAPKMAPHIPQMVSRIAEDIGVSPQQVNVKAKTNEKLGYLGREEGMAVKPIALFGQVDGVTPPSFPRTREPNSAASHWARLGKRMHFPMRGQH